MKITKLSASAAADLAVETLHLDKATVELVSTEGLSASLRRAASFMCPTDPRALIDAVYSAIHPLCVGKLSREDVSAVLELLVTSGDLLELRQGTDRPTRLLYLAPPSNIERMPGTYLVLGIRPFGAALLETDTEMNIEYQGHTRTLRLDPAEAPRTLQALGLQQIPREQWVASPAAATQVAFVDRYRSRLNVANKAGQLDGLKLLGPGSVRYYRGRWRSPTTTDTGDFVVRRPQAYGADLWCLARFEAGIPQRLVELPIADPVVPGRDEAWRYQAAVDALHGVPQQFGIRTGQDLDADTRFDFYSPLPSFAERYLQLVGLSLGRTTQALFSFHVPTKAVDSAAAFLKDMLWMTQMEVHDDV
ncbi:hypothetical protein ACIA8C_04760 [Nocardia sp. NPDC051321]|uniref:hypothetical protein n=1 Tax=Nocardia sp. NPDC051321 TaxID=3364323 RepID=UPI00379ECFD9